MIEVSNVALPLDAGLPGADDLVLQAVSRALRVPERRIAGIELVRRSVDARKRAHVHFVATFAVTFADSADEQAILAKGPAFADGVRVKPHHPYEPLDIPDLHGHALRRPVVVGFGPAGMFAAVYLARAGLRPLVLERGGSVEERQRAVAAFDAGGPLDVQTNIQFGEGGAGTFSDGKLTTGTKSPLAQHVLRWFVDAGAPREILVEAKPHIGTDKLVTVVRALREEVERRGGEVRFHSQAVGFEFCDPEHVVADDGTALSERKLAAVDVLDTRTGARERVATDNVILACGHSARDTFALARECGLVMRQKPFSVGVRIEHRQRAIDRAQYGKAASHPALGAADYKMAVHLKNGRSVYTFCMCPGGEVVCAASEEGGVVVNGMSRFARDGRNANAALLVGVGPGDFPTDDPLAGVAFQRSIERAAYEAGIRAGARAYSAPAQTVGDFLGKGDAPEKRGGTKHAQRVEPTYARGVAWCDLHECLPAFVTDALEEALPLLDRRLHGFADEGAVMTGVETRSSSPVRIVRDAALQAQFAEAVEGVSDEVRAAGLFPAGEGPGYAGGIMSSAVDGLRCAQAVAQRISGGAAADPKGVSGDDAADAPRPSAGRTADSEGSVCGAGKDGPR